MAEPPPSDKTIPFPPKPDDRPPADRTIPFERQQKDLTPRPPTERTKPPPGGAPAEVSDSRSRTEPDIPAEVEEAAGDANNVYSQYVLVRQLGKGGMGTVWKAFDRKLLRWVAIKFLLVGDEESVKRFTREAQLAARLRHPNIAPVFDVCEIRGQHVIVMEFIDGASMDKLQVPMRDLIELFVKVCAGVDAAHKAGVVHRDLKPQNVMVTREGWPYVMDFGLAKALRSESSLSVTGAVMGTPAYMSPEQAQGHLDKIDAQSDVYSLGATLYALLTRKQPFSGQSPMEILMKVCKEETSPPRKIDPQIPLQVETIILKAMSKEKPDRYASAGEMGEDLKRYLAGDQILARPPSSMKVMVRTAKRHIWPVVAAGALIVAGGVAVYALTRPAPDGGGTDSDAKTRREEAWLVPWLELRPLLQFGDWQTDDAAAPTSAREHLARMSSEAAIRDADMTEQWFHDQLRRARAELETKPAYVADWGAAIEAATRDVDRLKRANEEAAALHASASWLKRWSELRAALEPDAWKPEDAGLAERARQVLSAAGTDLPSGAADWFRSRVASVRGEIQRIRADRDSWAAKRARARHLASWSALVVSCLQGTEPLKAVAEEADRAGKDAAPVVGYAGTFTLTLAVGPYAEIEKLTRGGQAVPMESTCTPLVMRGLPIGDYEIVLRHPEHGSVTVKIASAQLADGKTYVVHGLMRERALKVAEQP